jgi:hypothetical protein
MTWNTIQENDVCKTVEKHTKNGRITVNLDKGERGTVLFPTAEAYGIASVNECGCLKEVGHALLTDVPKSFYELDGSDQLICLANGIAEITGDLALLREVNDSNFVCEFCQTDCSNCQLLLEDCVCEDQETETCNCGCCHICGCHCDMQYDDSYDLDTSDKIEEPIQA